MVIDLLKKVAPVLILCFATLFTACENELDGIVPSDPDPEEPIDKPFIDIPDANFERMLIARGMDTDGQINQRIFEEDALNVTALDLFVSDDVDQDQKIRDLSGIEGFTNLKELIVGNHSLTEIALNENIALEKLYLNYNQLSSIDLSANTALTFLSINRNELEEIDLSKNVNLTYLSLSANQLSSLDVSQNTQLVKLEAGVNALTSITGLEKTQDMESLNLSWNYLAALTVNIPELEGLNVEQNELSSLNIDGSSALKVLIATQNQISSLNTQNNLALEHLKISFNKIEALQLSSNLALQTLWTSRNQLQRLDVSSLSQLYDLRIVRNQDLTCVKIGANQEIATVQKENYQNLSTEGCN